MSFRGKQVVDFWLGGLLLLCLFLPIRALGLLLRRNHSLDARRGCTVVKLVGAGSLFLAMPSLQAIRTRFPDGAFFLVGTRAVAEFARDFGWFDEYWIIDDSSVWRLVSSTVRVLWLAGRRSDHLIDLEVHSRLTTVLGVLTTVRNRIGFVDEIVFWRHSYYTHVTYFNTHGNVCAFYDLLAAWFGIEQVSLQGFNGSVRTSAEGAVLPDEISVPARYLCIGPGCSDLGRERQLTSAEWLRILEGRQAGGAAVVVLGTSADRSLGDEILAGIGGGVNLCGQLTIRQSTRVLARAERYFGIDSLLLHLARGLSVPATSLWGPSDPQTRLRPSMAADQVYYVKLPCSPCIHVHEKPPCGGARPCMAASLDRLTQPLPSGGAGPATDGISFGWATGPDAGHVRSVAVRCD